MEFTLPAPTSENSAIPFNRQGEWNQNAVINEADGMDAALGHPAPVMRANMIEGFVQGQYHHQRPVSWSRWAVRWYLY